MIITRNTFLPARMGNNLTNAAPIRATLLVVALLLLYGTSFAGADSYAKSNAGIKNIQASSPTFAGATDRTSACVDSAACANHRSESWIAVDPTNANHLVGMSKFFFDPLFYLFHIGSYVSFDGGKSWANAVVPGFDCQSAPTFLGRYDGPDFGL